MLDDKLRVYMVLYMTVLVVGKPSLGLVAAFGGLTAEQREFVDGVTAELILSLTSAANGVS